MHNAGFESLGLNYLYLTQDVLPENLASALAGFRLQNIGGLSVTAPHKVSVLKLLDSLTKEAKEIGACNTIALKESKLVGHNTDFSGAIECLKTKTELKSKKVLILGAGGVARAIVYGLLKEKAHITIANRTIEKAKGLASSFDVKYSDINNPEIYEEYDILINATTVGSKRSEDCTCALCKALFSPNREQTNNAFSLFLPDKIALDVVFIRNTTEFTNFARLAGHNVVYGHEMLVAQGAIQFKLFTGCDAPRDVMYSELKSNLEDW